MAAADWWQDDWTTLPVRRNEGDLRQRWPLDVQVAGPLEPLRAALQADGWRVQPQADWVATIALLDDDTPEQSQVVLPATLDARAEAILLLHDGARPDEQYAVRLWPAPVALADGTPLWLGTTQTLQVSKPLGAAVLWRPVAHDGEAHAEMRSALDGFDTLDSPHPDTGMPVLRIRTTGRR